MNRPAHIWIPFGISVLLALAAMAFVSFAALEAEEANREARSRESVEDRIRLALWRMDSAIAPILARENARPHYTYQSLYPAERAYTSLFAEIEGGEIQIASPLLAQDVPFIRLHFELSSSGALTSPQVPTGNMRDVAEVRHVTYERIESYSRYLAELTSQVDPESLLAAVDGSEPAVASLVMPTDPSEPSEPTPVSIGPADDYSQKAVAQQRFRNELEWNARVNVQCEILSNNGLSDASVVSEGPLRPVWLDGRLLLLREIECAAGGWIQGAWVDWDALRESLARLVSDVLPAASFHAITGPTPVERRLASLPIRLDPGALQGAAPEAASALGLSLGAAWACFLLATGAFALLLRGTIAMSERRWAFASSVTHELRTPLTTFRMYTEMLSEGMVSDEGKRRDYLSTLRDEADRLGHLVENVLAYARLERGATGRSVEATTLSELFGRIGTRLERRAAQGGMQLDVAIGQEDGDAKLHIDASAVEQILQNLVDNACKYAASDDPHLEITSAREGDRLCLRVRDHGEGIPRSEDRMLFRPFRKGSRHESMQKPGIGLGLALSRQLARTMGGELRHDPAIRDGASFVLELPLAS